MNLKRQTVFPQSLCDGKKQKNAKTALLQGYKPFFMLNSTKFILLINVKMPTSVNIYQHDKHNI